MCAVVFAPDVIAPDLIADELACRRGERLVFAAVSFRLPPGGALVLTGSNGSGKSSLLRLCAGLLAAASGRLAWGDMPVAADLAAHRARLHYVGHQDAVKPAMTAREMLAFWAALRGLSLRAIRTLSTGHSPPSRSKRSRIGPAAGCLRDSGGGWRSPGCWSRPPRCGCSTSRRARSTATARRA